MIWPEKGGEVPYGPLTRLDLKLRISGHVGGPLIIRIEAEGYGAQMWWFEGGWMLTKAIRCMCG